MFSYTSDGAKNCVVTKTFEDSVIKEVTAEYNLPDYLPDVSRLLRTDARICRAGKYINAGTLEYDGTICFCAVYSTADGVMKSAAFESDYSGSMTLGDFSGDCDVGADTTMESVSCRPQNPRKLTARAKVRVTSSIMCAECTSPSIAGKLSPGEEAGIQYKNEKLDCCFRIAAADPDVSASEDFVLAPPLPEIGELVSVSLDPYLTEIKAGEGSVSYKGAVTAYILYGTAEETENSPNKYVSVIRRIPIAGETAAEGLSENCVCIGNCSVISLDYAAQPDTSGENRTVAVSFSYSVYIDAFCNAKSEITSDMYSADYESTAEYQNVSYRTALGAKCFNFSQSGCTELSDSDFGDVAAISGKANVTGAEKSGGKLVFTGNADVSAILSNGDGVYTGKNFQVPFRAETDAGFVPDDFDYTALASVISITGRTDGKKLCADMEISVSYAVFADKECSVVSKLNVLREKPRIRPVGAGITLYYPQKNESLWDIAKKYGTTKAELAARNGISGELSQNDVMIIPRKEPGKAIYTKII